MLVHLWRLHELRWACSLNILHSHCLFSINCVALFFHMSVKGDLWFYLPPFIKKFTLMRRRSSSNFSHFWGQGSSLGSCLLQKIQGKVCLYFSPLWWHLPSLTLTAGDALCTKLPFYLQVISYFVYWCSFHSCFGVCNDFLKWINVLIRMIFSIYLGLDI